MPYSLSFDFGFPSFLMDLFSPQLIFCLLLFSCWRFHLPAVVCCFGLWITIWFKLLFFLVKLACCLCRVGAAVSHLLLLRCLLLRVAKSFWHTAPQQNTARYLIETVQGNRSVAEFAVVFHTAVADSGWTPTVLYKAFYWGLFQVKDELAARELPLGLGDLISLATRIDRRI